MPTPPGDPFCSPGGRRRASASATERSSADPMAGGSPDLRFVHPVGRARAFAFNGRDASTGKADADAGDQRPGRVLSRKALARSCRGSGWRWRSSSPTSRRGVGSGAVASLVLLRHARRIRFYPRGRERFAFGFAWNERRRPRFRSRCRKPGRPRCSHAKAAAISPPRNCSKRKLASLSWTPETRLQRRESWPWISPEAGRARSCAATGRYLTASPLGLVQPVTVPCPSSRSELGESASDELLGAAEIRTPAFRRSARAAPAIGTIAASPMRSCARRRAAG